MDRGLRDYLDATVPESESAEWITPWCYSIGIGRLVDHVWIRDRDATICTECSVNLEDWKKAMSR